MKKALALISLAVTSATFAACKGETLPIGGEDTPMDGGPEATGGPAAEIWAGYLENFHFPSGSDRMTLTLTRDDASGVAGTCYFGEQPPLPAPTDPDVGYPTKYLDAGWGGPQVQAPYDQYPFTVMDASRVDNRLQFDVVTNELYKAWCELQTTIYPVYNYNPTGPGTLLGYGCLPNAAVGTGGCDGFDAGAQSFGVCNWDDHSGSGCHQVDCLKLELCRTMDRPCTCTQTKCTVDLASRKGPGPILHVDLQISGNQASGSVAGLGSPVNVHLTRQ